jgi:uncharacterized membrane protein
MRTRLVILLIAIVAFLGLLNAMYLFMTHEAGSSVTCLVSGDGCQAVAESPYSEILGIPLALLGSIFYGAVFVLAALALSFKHVVIRRLIFMGAVAGLLFSVYTSVLMVFVIQAFCEYCALSIVDSVLLFILAVVLMRSTKGVE